MSVSEIQLYNALKSKLGDKEALELVEFVKKEIKSELESKTDRFATKEDLERGFKDQLKWIIILVFGQTALLLSLVKFIQ